MRTLIGNFAGKLVLAIIILSLGAPGAGATVSGDVAAGLELSQVVANGLAAGLSVDSIMTQALEAGVDPGSLFKAAVGQADLSQVIKFALDKGNTDANFSTVYGANNLMSLSVEAGKDPVMVANAMMAAGANLAQVRGALASVNYAGADTYAYSPPAPPGLPAGAAGATFPGGGGGGGGGGTASPSA